MRIRQEVWSPTTSWKTALSHGDIHQSGIVFCFGNPGKQNTQAIYNEVKHSFPGADLVFAFLDESHEEKLFLTAFECDRNEFVLDQVSLNKVSEDSNEISARFEEKKWQQMMLGIDADKNYATQVLQNLDKACTENFKTRNIQRPSHRIQMGLNMMPEYNRAICMASTGNSFGVSLKQKSKSASKGATAAQTMWDRYAGSIVSGSEAYTFYFPIALLGK